MSQSAREHWRIVPCQYVLKPPPGGLTCKLLRALLEPVVVCLDVGGRFFGQTCPREVYRIAFVKTWRATNVRKHALTKVRKDVLIKGPYSSLSPGRPGRPLFAEGRFFSQDVIEKFGLRDVRTKAIEAKLQSLSQDADRRIARGRLDRCRWVYGSTRG